MLQKTLARLPSYIAGSGQRGEKSEVLGIKNQSGAFRIPFLGQNMPFFRQCVDNVAIVGDIAEAATGPENRNRFGLRAVCLKREIVPEEEKWPSIAIIAGPHCRLVRDSALTVAHLLQRRSMPLQGRR
ncbi:MAG TPA: hypothetical protein VKU93_01885 [Terracidiphilus sp.]|nr:hypothetical protein [Terracidiphilus sp.]